jgi:phage FluMu protein gp41
MIDKQWDGLTISDELPIGVLYAGVRHKRFTLRLQMAGDLIDAQEAMPEASVRLIALDLFRRQLLVLGDIPPEAITTDLLRQQLSEVDLAVLEQADQTLGKRLAPASVGSSTGAASSTSSSDTATG